MNRIRPWIIAALAAALTLSIIGVASAQPGPPPTFLGTVTSDDGSPVAAGLLVEAHVGETNCTAEAPVTYTSDGATKYFVFLDTQTEGCSRSGDEVRFRVGGRWATETASIGIAGSPIVNLTLGPPTVTIDVAVWRVIADPSRLFISTRVPGEAWDTDSNQLELTPYTNPRTGRITFDRSDLRSLEVELQDGSTVTIEVAVWRVISDPSRLFISTRVPGESWDTDSNQLQMAPYTNPRTGRVTFDRSDLRSLEVAIE